MNTDRKNQMLKFIEMVNKQNPGTTSYRVEEITKEKKEDKFDWCFSVYQYDIPILNPEADPERRSLIHDPTDLMGGAKGLMISWYVSAKSFEDDYKPYPCIRFF